MICAPTPIRVVGMQSGQSTGDVVFVGEDGSRWVHWDGRDITGITHGTLRGGSIYPTGPPPLRFAIASPSVQDEAKRKAEAARQSRAEQIARAARGYAPRMHAMKKSPDPPEFHARSNPPSFRR